MTLQKVAQILTPEQVETDLLEHMENLLLDVDKVCHHHACRTMHFVTKEERNGSISIQIFTTCVHTCHQVWIYLVQHLHVLFSIISTERREEMLALLLRVRT